MNRQSIFHPLATRKWIIVGSTLSDSLFSFSGSARHNPYSTGGRTYLRRYRNKAATSRTPCSSFSTPPRVKYLKRTERIVSSSSRPGTQRVDGSNLGKWMTTKGLSPQPTKRTFGSVLLNGRQNSADLLDSDNDDEFENLKKTGQVSEPKKTIPAKQIFSALSDSDCEFIEQTDISSSSKENSHKKVKDSEDSPECDFQLFDRSGSPTSDKENSLHSHQKERSLFSPPKPSSIKVYTNKRKSVNVSRSRILGDFSPERIEKAYGGNKCMYEEEKENVPTRLEEQSSSSAEVTSPHLIGLVQYTYFCNVMH